MPHRLCAAFLLLMLNCHIMIKGERRGIVSLWAAFALAVVVFVSCASQGMTEKNKYVVSPATDTLTILLPGLDNEFCRVRVYGGGADFMASEYVADGCVKFCVSTLPAGRHRVLVRAGGIVADEVFVKR